MFLDELFEKVKRLPYNEQQLFIKLSEMLIEIYKKNVKEVGEAEAYKRLCESYKYILELNSDLVIDNGFQKTL